MRVISGKYRSLVLTGFAGREIRPTSDRVKESLFDILSGRVVSARVLDLFCGSGALGIECLSRGAAEAHFNDISKSSLGVLSANLKKLKNCPPYKVTCCDYSECLLRLCGKFDIVFIDPPYSSEAGLGALEGIASRSLLAEDGVAVYERDRAFAGEAEGLTLFDERKYGKTYLSFFKVSK